MSPDRELSPPEDVPPVSAEALVGSEVVEEAVERRYPSTIGGACYLLALTVALVGLGITWSGAWRTGIYVFSGALVFAALVRVVLRDHDAGMLAVRNRPLDAGILLGVAATLIYLATDIPDQV